MIHKIVYSLAFLLIAACCVAQRDVNFKHLRVDHGLVSNHINTVIKDAEGYVWFGTNTGLSRYDGFRFKSYSNLPNHASSLLNNMIVDLFVGFDRKLWVRTSRGNCVYDQASDCFVWNVDSILLDKGFLIGDVRKIIRAEGAAYVLYQNGALLHSPSVGEQEARPWGGKLLGKITDIDLDRIRHVLVMVTDMGEVVSVDSQSLQVQQRTSFPFERLVENSDFQLFVDDSSGVWVYAKNFPFGALHYKTIDANPAIFKHLSGTFQVNNNYISNIQQLGQQIWLATDHGGINVYDMKTGAIHYLMHDRTDMSSLPYNSMTTLYKDRDGVMWVGMYKGGISYYHPDLNYFSLFQNQAGYPESLPFNDINCFVEDRKGMIWIGTNGGGLVRFDPKEQSFRSYTHDVHDERSLGSNVVVSLYTDKEDELWVGTYHGGLNKFEEGSFQRFLHSSDDARSINDNSVWSIFQDSRERFWVGMLSGGVDLFTRSGSSFQRFKSAFSADYGSSYNSKIIEDRRGNIWIGMSNGVAKLSPEDRLVVYNEASEDFALTNNVVSDILEDRMDNIWVATQTGINILSDNKITYLSTAQGLIDNIIVGLVMDDYGDVWATTPKGISRIQYIREFDGYTVQNYDKSDGLQSSNFNERAIYKLRDGRLLFGGSEGFNIYAPQPVRRTEWQTASVVDFRIPSGGISSDHIRQLVGKWKTSMHISGAIRVPHQVHTFTLLLADFDFIGNHRVKVQYQLKGLSNDWLDMENMEITLANLESRDYTLFIRGLDYDGSYSTAVSLLDIHIAAPWWRTKWAYLLYLLTGVAVLLFFRRMEKMRTHTRFNMMQIEEKARHAKELEEMRTRFFTNVSHEFRTPISLIISPINKLKNNETDAGKRKYLDIIERNASSLLHLVNQLLDLNKIEKQEHKLRQTFGDTVSVLRRITEGFESIAQTKNIRYVVDMPDREIKAYLDFEKLERIVLNLLSNAFKFTPDGGTVGLVLRFEDGDSQLRMEVCDTGVGVPVAEQNRVFDRYYQAEDHTRIREKGSGLGLSIVREFVAMMSGELQFVSEKDCGTTVTIVLPLQLAPEEVISSGNSAETVSKSHKVRKDQGNGIQSENPLKILIVEDHADFAFYLKDNLKDFFQTEVYSSVEEAKKHIFSFHPDIIVSDLHLPGQSGIEFCKTVRANERTRHIPFVLITAVGAEDRHLEALAQGATDFITKPFSFDVFLSKIKRLIEQQDIMAKRYKRQVDVNVGTIEVENEDERFILKLTTIIEDHLQDENFSVEILASQMHITRVGLYKKILSITGFTPTEYIRNIRLNKALDLLKNTTRTVSEISYEVGFGSPKQFSKYFKSFYGDVPSALRK